MTATTESRLTNLQKANVHRLAAADFKRRLGEIHRDVALAEIARVIENTPDDLGAIQIIDLLETAQAVVLIDLGDQGKAVGVGNVSGEGVAAQDVLVSLLDTAGEVAREGWRVVEVTA